MALYTDYELNKKFDKKYFGPELSATTDSAYSRDSSFWNTVRLEPLSEKEVRFVRYRDSIYAYTHSKAYLDSIDRRLNRITWQKLLYQGQPLSNHEKRHFIQLPVIIGND
ncbi:MAG: hypothetical protein IPH58_02730 [Sphingobacteriales bacterium]|nr:hypothetical protein [Sphingobacteriales bacterium]